MDYNNNNRGMNQGMPGQGMPMQGMPGQGMPGQNMAGRMPNQGMPMQGAPNQGIPGQRMPGPGMPNPGMPMQGAPNQGMPGQRMPGPGMPMQGAPNQGMPGQRIPGQGMPNPNMAGRMPNPGMPMQGALNQGVPGQRMPGPGMPGQGAMNRGMPGQGMPGQNMAGPNVTGRMPINQAAAAGKGIEGSLNERIRSRNPLPPQTPSDNPERGGSRLFDTDNKAPGKDHAILQGIAPGLSGFSPYIYGGILVLCLTIALIVYGSSHKGTSSKKYNIPKDMLTYTGIFRDIYEKAASGTLGSATAMAGTLYDDDGTPVPAAPTPIGAAPYSEDETSEGSGTSSADSGTGAVTGATMELDSGGSSGTTAQAESYKELIEQLESAITSGDTAFVGSKLAYEDEDGTLRGYPQSIVDHFVTYMSTNSDKRQSLMMELTNDKYSAQNDKAFVVKLPYIKFVVNMGYDNTTISIPGFSDQVVNAGQSADIAPLLPCMYTLTISNPEWPDSVTRDIEANVNESTISINIKP